MNQSETPKCPHCDVKMNKWRTPLNSTWSSPFQWVCFNDECPYFIRGWEHMMETQDVKASYRHRLDPGTGTSGPLPAWSNKAHRDQIIDD